MRQKFPTNSGFEISTCKSPLNKPGGWEEKESWSGWAFSWSSYRKSQSSSFSYIHFLLLCHLSGTFLNTEPPSSLHRAPSSLRESHSPHLIYYNSKDNLLPFVPHCILLCHLAQQSFQLKIKITKKKKKGILHKSVYKLKCWNPVALESVHAYPLTRSR